MIIRLCGFFCNCFSIFCFPLSIVSRSLIPLQEFGEDLYIEGFDPVRVEILQRAKEKREELNKRKNDRINSYVHRIPIYNSLIQLLVKSYICPLLPLWKLSHSIGNIWCRDDHTNYGVITPTSIVITVCYQCTCFY